MKKLLLAASAIALTGIAAPAKADDDLFSPWVIRAGVAYLDVSDKLDLKVAGAPVPDAALHFSQVYTAMAEIVRPVSEDFAVALTVGFPPHIGVRGGGSISAFGKLEDTTFGPTALTLQYQPFHEGIIRPYIGAGASYMIIFSTHDAVIQHTALSDDLAPAFEAGTDLALTQQFGLFVEAKKAFLQTKATGDLAGFAVDGIAKIDPWVFSAGGTVRF